MLGDTPTTRGRFPVQKARSGGRLKQERVPALRSGDVSVVRARGCRLGAGAGQAGRVHHDLLVANIVEDHHEGVLLAACGRSRAPGVMTTTLRANAHKSYR